MSDRLKLQRLELPAEDVLPSVYRPDRGKDLSHHDQCRWSVHGPRHCKRRATWLINHIPFCTLHKNRLVGRSVRRTLEAAGAYVEVIQ